jgi:DNA replication ATP-dependent helicase Dna2
LNQVGDTTVGRERILPLLMGRKRPLMDAASYDRAITLAEDLGLNFDQAEAFAQAYATDSAYLIQGPPGTGKTRVLAHLAQTLVADGERVLITAFTHRAINNALNKLAEVAPDVAAIKIGEPSRADGLVENVENYESFQDSPLADLSEGYVVGATPFATRSQRLGGVEFETVIFDEASQITLPLAIMGMLSAKRYIFIGDQEQLPPVLVTRKGDEALRASVFGTLVDRHFDTMLTESYRLSAELAEWSSEQFYQGKLKPTTEAAGRRVVYATPPRRWAEVLAPDHPKVFIDLLHRNTTTRSRTEADVVANLIMTLAEIGFPLSEIGVVTPYRAQAREIRNLVQPLIADVEQRRQLVVDTVERMQGQERDLIIFSLATSNPAFASQLAEFFFQPERLNVAITRPRRKLIIVGSSQVLTATAYMPDEPLLAEMLTDLLASCYNFVPDYVV